MQSRWGKQIGFACFAMFLTLMITIPAQAAPSDTTLIQTLDVTTWIVANKASSNIVFVTTAGDTVNMSSSNTQYQNADSAIDILDAGGV